ncbi:PEP-CTERM sorting domain-containing protein [Rheinheimera salexigens]|uniref:PEP-CTERM protein-sorting domain-containing protein n=1 Tax=Rheinheimera salexigens TaxID=1628148 RepID=A0A1E7Q3V2_9GAMM|nr:PEP-CTERM sorting domain-containing protein [Rheinheimera salexigens]OEY68753.1 hypothetical protein BI198_03595 [Rheinheimera salexigens]
MIKKSIFILMLALFSFSLMPQSAQAGPILTQELLIEDPTGPIPIGWLSIDLDDIVAGEVMQWNTFTLFGFDIGTSFGFFADYDPSNLAAGFTFLSFDVNDVTDTFAFQGFWDIDFAPGFIDVFTADDGDLLISESLVLGPASLVSEPATAFLFLMAAGGLLLRRRRS